MHCVRATSAYRRKQNLQRTGFKASPAKFSNAKTTAPPSPAQTLAIAACKVVLFNNLDINNVLLDAVKQGMVTQKELEMFAMDTLPVDEKANHFLDDVLPYKNGAWNWLVSYCQSCNLAWLAKRLVDMELKAYEYI